MNDLTIITEFGRTLDGDSRGPSPDLRADIIRRLAGPPRPRQRRPVRRVALAGGLAVAAAVGLLASSSLGLWGGSSGASAEAAVLLRHAATVAARAPVQTPSADQFIYVKSVETAAVIANTSVREQTNLREVWASVDGTRTGLIRTLPAVRGAHWQATSLAGCSNGAPVGTGAPNANGPCSPTPAYHAGLPTTTGAMLAYLYSHSQGQNPPDVQAFITAGDLIRESLVQPAALAAVFRAVARIPGVTVAQHATNADGQRGIGVQQTYHGISEQLIFNPRTFAFIGEREVVVAAGAGLPVGTVMDSTAILAAGVVGHAGQFPQ